jgi:DNA-binding NtrC family response regulator
MTLGESAFSRSLRPVLLVDGCGEARAAIAEAARAAGFLARTAASPQRARVQLAREDERCDALVVPLDLGEREARELVDEARRLRPRLPLLLLRSGSGGAGEEAIAGAWESPVRVAPVSPASAVVRSLEALLADAAGASRECRGRGEPAPTRRAPARDAAGGPH